MSGFLDMGFRHLGRFWIYRGNSVGGEPERTLRAYGLILVTTCTYDLTKLKWRNMPTGYPPGVSGFSDRGFLHLGRFCMYRGELPRS